MMTTKRGHNFADHVTDELGRISKQIAGPNPLHHTALYAAQQALCWAAQPSEFASPVDAIVGNAEGSECYSVPHRHFRSLDTDDHSEPQ